MKSDWFNLERELDKWGQAGNQACFWWRDDDLEAPGPNFERLLELRRDVPLSLAVIPKMAKPQITKSIGACKEIDIIQHGFAHKIMRLLRLKEANLASIEHALKFIEIYLSAKKSYRTYSANNSFLFLLPHGTGSQ